MRGATLGGSPSSIVVAGDVIIDFMRVTFSPLPIAGEAGYDWQNYQGATLTHRSGGALLIADLLKSNLEGTGTDKLVVSYQRQKDQFGRWIVNGRQPEELVRSFATVQQFAAHSSDDRDQIFRTAAFSGFAGPGPALEFPPHKASRLVIISETGNGFRNNKQMWPDAITTKSRPLIILKSGSLFIDRKSRIYKNELLDFLLRYHGERLVVVVNADDLRNDGALISRSISWERTALECISEIKGNSILAPLRRCRNLVIRCGLDGVIYFRSGAKGSSVTYDPIRVEGDYNLQFSGLMSGYGSVFCASLALDIYRDDFPEINGAPLELYIRNALVSTRRLLRFGLGRDQSDLRIQHEEVFSRSASARYFVKSNAPNRINAHTHSSATWSFRHEIENSDLPKLATEIVKTGKVSPGDKGIPLGRFGALETIDRSEIESYRTIRNLIREFLLAINPTRPLSIAVFGQPGSGKSFGITEIVNELRSMKVGNVGDRHTFNVAQFTSDKDLTAAFHLARDEILKGEVPVLFFDEFDAKFDGKPLYWLQYFLAPMQDGTFRDERSIHSIGRAILVFAGGVYRSFQEFAEDEEKFVNEKLPDFKSRLRGYVDILSPNPSDKRDKSHLLRRAVILRSLLKRKCTHLINSATGVASIDEGVLNAFLQVKEYKHDVRSMEALLDMSMLAGRNRFDSSALPTDNQMRMHVDPDEFLGMVAGENTRLRNPPVRRSGRR